MIISNINTKPKVSLFFITFLLFIFIFYSQLEASEAKSMTIKEALQWGLENNYELNIMRNSVKDLERNLEILDASKAVQVDLSVTPIWYFGKNGETTESEGYITGINGNVFAPSTKVSLSATKQLNDNISLSTELTWESDNLYQGSLDQLTDEVNANLKINKNIYPKSWSENEKQVYSIENSLKIKLKELRWEETEKQIEFIRDYLNINRLQEEVDIVRERRNLAEEDLVKTKKQIELGEGGYQQETEARIALEDAENNLLNQEQNLIRAKKQWSLSLNLPKEIAIEFEDNVDFIELLYSQMEDLKIGSENEENLIQGILVENYQIKNSQVEREGLVKELEWMKDEGKPSINLSGGYNYPDADWFVMIDFSMNLADGGAQKLKEKQKETNIKQKEISIAYLSEQLRLEAEQLLGQDEYNLLYLNTQRLAWEKEQDKLEITEKQYQQGVISEAQWENALLTVKEKEIKVKQAEDEWFVNRLMIAHFIGCLQEEI